MSKMQLSIRHDLGENEALSRIKGLLGDLKDQFGDQIKDLQEEWIESEGKFAFKAMGFSVSGELIVKERQVVLEAKIPFAAVLFKGKIEAKIMERAESLLA